MIKKNVNISFVILLLLLFKVNGEHESAGTTIFPFLNLSYDARSRSMLNTTAGVKNGVYGIFSNPSSIGYGPGIEASISYHPIILDVNSGAVAYSRRVKEAGRFAFSLQYLSAGKIEAVDKINGEIKNLGVTYSPYSMSGCLTWSREIIQDMSLGINVKGIYDNLGGDERYTAKGIAADFGWQYRMLSSRLVWGAVINNLGYLLSGYTPDYDDLPLPFSMQAGFSYQPEVIPSFMFAFDLQKSIDDYLNYRAAVEFLVFDPYLYLRGGFLFSQQDLEKKAKEWFVVDESINSGVYQKSNWDVAAIGIGIVAPMEKGKIQFDVSLNFRVDHLPPSLSFSGIISL